MMTLYLWLGFMYGLMMCSLTWKCVNCFEFEHSQPLPLQDWNNNATYKAAAAAAFAYADARRTPPLMVGLTLVTAAASKGLSAWTAHYQGTTSTEDMDQGQTVGSFNWRAEDGVIQSENVFLVRKHAMVLHIIWKSRYLLKAFSATKMKKILIFIIGTGSRFVIVMVDLSVETVKMRQHNSIFRGQRIWSVVMEDLMSKGMRYANQALLSGCSAGGLASILHCDEFRHLFPRTARVKCLSDAGLFLDVPDISGWRTLRYMFAGVVMLQNHVFPLNTVPYITGCKRTCRRVVLNASIQSCAFSLSDLLLASGLHFFLVNTAYDTWQIQVSLAPASADHHGYWNGCRKNYARCTGSQISFLQGFRNQMLYAVRGFSRLKKNGLFINSCFAHCQTERQDTWFSPGSPHIKSKGIAESVGNWYFDRAVIMAIDCPYPCDHTCHHLVFK